MGVGPAVSNSKGKIAGMSDEKSYPRVGLAYEFVLPSYEWAMKRLDAVDGRIQTLQTLIIGTTLAVPVFARAVLPETSLDFGSVWFVLALLAFVLSIGTGMVARASGTIKLLSPDKLYERYLSKDQEQFKKDVLYYAGAHAVDNHRLVLFKGRAQSIMTGLFLAEVILLVLWITNL